MYRRIEPRFPVNAPVRVTVLGNPDRELVCRLTETSANGVKLLCAEKLAEDTIIGLDLEFHFMLAVIRHSYPVGDKHALGVERIHVVDKDALRSGEPKGDQMRAILAEQGWSLPPGAAGQSEIAVAAVSPPEPDPHPPSPSRPWRFPAAVAAGLAIAALAVTYFLQFRGPDGTGKAQSQAVPAPPAEATITAPVSAPPVLAPALSRRLQIKALSTTWVAVTADGRDVLARLLNDGETREIEFSRVAHVRLGTASGVEISFNGKPLGPLGRSGELRLIEFTPEEFRFLPWTDRDR